MFVGFFLLYGVHRALCNGDVFFLSFYNIWSYFFLLVTIQKNQYISTMLHTFIHKITIKLLKRNFNILDHVILSKFTI